MEKPRSAKHSFYFVIALLLCISFFIAPSLFLQQTKTIKPDIFVGVDASFSTIEETKQIINIVKPYTNLFVVGSTAITWNLTSLTEICQYLNDSNLQFMTFAHPAADKIFSQTQWVKNARQMWNQNFVGLYVYDEPGGHQIDHDYIFMSAQEASNYSDAATIYVKNLTYYLSLVKTKWDIGNFPLFTSDYALYEYDYRAGYDAIFTEFNSKENNRQLAIALGRGAATVHKKDWGIMITGNLTDNIQSGQKMYEDMILAYQNGAKYILIFDYPNLQGGILQQEHFDAMKKFWTFIQSNPQKQLPVAERTAYIIPKDYGFGFRGSNDKIWGLWEADNQSDKIWNEANNLITQYETNLDIVYQDSFQLSLTEYGQLIYWNESKR